MQNITILNAPKAKLLSQWSWFPEWTTHTERHISNHSSESIGGRSKESIVNLLLFVSTEDIMPFLFWIPILLSKLHPATLFHTKCGCLIATIHLVVWLPHGTLQTSCCVIIDSCPGRCLLPFCMVNCSHLLLSLMLLLSPKSFLW